MSALIAIIAIMIIPLLIRRLRHRPVTLPFLLRWTAISSAIVMFTAPSQHAQFIAGLILAATFAIALIISAITIRSL